MAFKPMPKMQRLRSFHVKNEKRSQRLRALGLTMIGVWVDKRVLEFARHRATALNLPASSVLRAATEVGLSRVGTSEIINVDRQYRTIVGHSPVPRYPGAPYDESRAGDLTEFHRRQRRRWRDYRAQKQEAS